MLPTNVIRTVIALVVVLGAIGLAQVTPSPRLLPFPEVRLGLHGEGAEGALWLSWSDGERIGFSRGFLQGYVTGWHRACWRAAELSPDDAYLHFKCDGAMDDLAVRAETYRDTATEFYTRYPEDRALPITRLFNELVARRLTVPQIHQWLDELVADQKKTASDAASPKNNPPAPNFTGAIVDKVEGAPVPRAYIWIHEEKVKATLTAQPDRSGRYAVHLPDGYYDVMFTAVGFSPFSKKIWVQSGKAIKLNVRFEPDRDTNTAD